MGGFTTIAVIIALLLLLSSRTSASLSAADDTTIQHLVSYIRHSGLEYHHGAERLDGRMVAHALSREYAAIRRTVRSAEEFIERAVAASTPSTAPVRVRLPDGSERTVGELLRAELGRYRTLRS
jgi:hypothetical protein